MARGGVAVAVIRVGRPSGELVPTARLTSCSEALDPSWTISTTTDKELLLRRVSEWLDSVWVESDGA